MRALWRVLVGLFALIGVVAVVLGIVGVLWLRSAPVAAGSGGAGSSASPSASATQSSGGLVADHLSADVTVPFATLERQAGNDVKLSDAGGGRIRVDAPFQALGRTWRVQTDGDMSVDGTDLVVQPTTLHVEGLGALDGLLQAVARQAAGVRTPITGLPKGAHVTSATSTAQGVRAHVTGDGVPLPQP